MITFAEQIMDFLTAQSLHVLILFAAVLAATFLLRGRSAHIRYLLWLLIVAKCLVPPLHTVSLAVLPERIDEGRLMNDELAEARQQRPTAGKSETIGISHSAEENRLEAGGSASRRAAIENNMVGSAQAESKPASVGMAYSTRESRLEGSGTIGERPAASGAEGERPIIGGITFKTWIPAVWLGGAAVYYLIMAVKGVRFDRYVRRHRAEVTVQSHPAWAGFLSSVLPEAKPVRIFQLSRPGQPFVWGLWRGAIYLPGNFADVNDSQKQQSILMHEAGHILRLDPVANLLQVVAQGLFWFHPLVWFANDRIRAEREKCCDEFAVAKLKTAPRHYCTAIVDALMAAQPSRPAVPTLAVAGPVKNIEDRIKTLLAPGKIFRTRPTAAAIISILLLAAIVVPTTIALTRKVTPPDYTLSGSVVDADGKPITGAIVFDDGYGPEPYQKGITNANGKFEYKSWNEEHNVTAKAEGFAPQTITFTTWPIDNSKQLNFKLPPETEMDKPQSWVLDFFKHNYRDISARKDIEWGEPVVHEDGRVSIRYKYEATIWGKDKIIEDKVWTFDKDGKFISVRKVGAEDIYSLAGVQALVDVFLANNYRDITHRKTIEWGQPVIHENGNVSVRYTYEETIWDKDKVINDQVFTFDKYGKFLSVKNSAGVITRTLEAQTQGRIWALSLRDGTLIDMNRNPATEIPHLQWTQVAGAENTSAMLISGDDIKIFELPWDFETIAALDDFDSLTELLKTNGEWLSQIRQNAMYRQPTRNWLIGSDVKCPYVVLYQTDDGTNGVLEVTRIQDRKADVRFKIFERPVSRNDEEEDESQSTESGKTGSGFSAVLANGMTVELVGICEHPSDGRQWWRPDGSWLSEQQRPYEKVSGKTKTINTKTYEAAFKLVGAGSDDASISIVGHGGLFAFYGKGVYCKTLGVDPEVEELELKVGIATGPWQADYEYEASINGGMEMSSMGEVIFARPIERNGKTVMTVSHRIDTNVYQIRLIAIDKSGKSVTSSYEGVGNDAYSQLTATFNLPIADTKAFRFQTRPYEWVTFKNVSLRPGVKTEGEVVAEKPEAGSQAAELPMGASEAVLLPDYLESHTVLSLKTGQFIPQQQADDSKEPYLYYNYTFPPSANPSRYNVHTIPEKYIGVDAGNMNLGGFEWAPESNAMQGLWSIEKRDALPDCPPRARITMIDHTTDGMFVGLPLTVPEREKQWPFITAFKGDDGTHGVFEITKVENRKIFVRFRTIESVDNSTAETDNTNAPIASVSEHNKESGDIEQNWVIRSSKRWFVTVIVDDQGQLLYNDQPIGFNRLQQMLKENPTPPKNTVLEVGYTDKAYRKLPVDSIAESAKLDSNFMQASVIVQEMGFESLSFIGRDDPSDRRGPISFRLEDRVNFCLGRDIKIDISDGWDLLDLDWLRFEQRGTTVTGRIQMTVRTRPKTKWEIALKLFDKEDKFIDSVFRYYENSGIFIGLPSVNREEQLFEFENLNVEQVGKFEIEVRKYADSAILRPGVGTNVEIETQSSLASPQASGKKKTLEVHLKNLFSACQRYQIDTGKWPETVDDLLRKEGRGPYIKPNDTYDFSQLWFVRPYVNYRKVTDPAKTHFLYDISVLEEHKEIAVVYLDGHVEFLNREHKELIGTGFTFFPSESSELNFFPSEFPELKSPASHAESSKLPTANYTAALPNGVTVELVGLCEYPSEGKQWWRPDGLPMNRPYEKIETTYLEPDYKLYELVCRVIGSDNTLSEIDTNETVMGSFGVFALPSVADQIQLSEAGLFSFACISCDPQAKASDITFLVGLDSLWKINSSMEIADSTIRAFQVAGPHAKIGIPSEKNGRTHVNISHNVRDQWYRILAMDKNRTVHPGIYYPGIYPGINTAPARLPKNVGSVTINTEFDLPLSDIKSIQFQTQQYQTITFKNVSLRPGAKTEVEVVTEEAERVPGAAAAWPEPDRDLANIRRFTDSDLPKNVFALYRVIGHEYAPSFGTSPSDGRRRILFSQTEKEDYYDASRPENYPLQGLILDKQPLFTEQDIVWYDWEYQQILLKPDVLPRLPQVHKPPVNVFGVPFVVAVYGQRIYLGTFWTLLSSRISAVPTIELGYPGTLLPENVIGIGGGGFIKDGQIPAPPHRDWRIRDALASAGLLKEQNAEYPSAPPPPSEAQPQGVIQNGKWVTDERGCKLEFRILAKKTEIPEAELAILELRLKENRPENDNALWVWRMLGDTFDGTRETELPLAQHEGKTYVLLFNLPEACMVADGSWGLEKTGVTQDNSGHSSIHVWLNDEGGRRMNELTTKFIDRRLAILIDDTVLIAPSIMMALSKQVAIGGAFTPEQARHIADALKKGMPPVYARLEAKTEGKIERQEAEVRSPAARDNNLEVRSRDTAFIATLANGVTVELMGICKHPSEGKWWVPNGNPLAAPAFEARMEREPMQAIPTQYTLLVRAAGGDNKALRMKIYEGIGYSTPFFDDGTALCIVKHPQPEQTFHQDAFIKGPVMVGVAQGDWIKSRDGVPDTLNMPRSFLIGARDQIVIQPPQQDKPDLGVTTFWGSCTSHDYELKLVCTLKDGTIRENMKAFYANCNTIETGGLHNSAIKTINFSFDQTPIDRISGYELYYREYQYARFNNVAFQAGAKTEVEVVTEKSGIRSQETEGSVQNTELRTQYTEFFATLANGVTVELLGATEYTEQVIHRNWWAPDGTPLDKELVNLYANLPEFINKEHPYRYVIAYQLKNEKNPQKAIVWSRPNNPAGSLFENSICGSFSIPVSPEESRELTNYGCAIVTSQTPLETHDITLKYSSDMWEVAASHPAEKIESEGGWTITDAHGKTEIRVPMSLVNEFVPDSAIAIDHFGKVHFGYGTQLLSQRNHVTFNRSLSEFREFQIRRPIYEQVTFKNVSLRPGMKTTVEAVIGEAQSVKVERAESPNAKTEVFLPAIRCVLDLSTGNVMTFDLENKTPAECLEYAKQQCGCGVGFDHDGDTSHLAFINALRVDRPTRMDKGMLTMSFESQKMPLEILVWGNDGKRYAVNILKAENTGCTIEYSPLPDGARTEDSQRSGVKTETITFAADTHSANDLEHEQVVAAWDRIWAIDSFLTIDEIGGPTIEKRVYDELVKWSIQMGYKSEISMYLVPWQQQHTFRGEFSTAYKSGWIWNRPKQSPPDVFLKVDFVEDGVWYVQGIEKQPKAWSDSLRLELLVDLHGPVPPNRHEVLLKQARERFSATRKPNPDWTVTCPNGAVVELAGISEFPSPGRQWWGPDGNPIGYDPVFWINLEATSREFRRQSHEKRFEMAFAISWPMCPNESKIFEVFVGNAKCLSRGGSLADNEVVVQPVKFNNNQESSDIWIRISTDGRNFEDITFKNVSLRPGAKTEVEVVIDEGQGQLLYNDQPIAADAQRQSDATKEYRPGGWLYG